METSGLQAIGSMGRFSRHKKRLRQLILLSVASFVILCFVVPHSPTSRVNMPFEEPVYDSLMPKIILLGNDNDIVNGKRQDGTKRLSSSSRLLGTDEQACRIPTLNINNSEVIKFFHTAAPLKCSGEKWAHVDGSQHLVISESAIRKHGAIRCTLIYVERVSDDELKFSKRIVVRDGDKITSDFSVINCTASNGKKWRHPLWSVVPDEKKVELLSQIEKPADWSGLDVYFIGFDSLSQMSFRRKMPKTVEFIEKELEAVVLNGYNIVGDGTPQAFIPILTGRTEEELPLTRKRFQEANYVDDVYPFVWKNFSDIGYITFYAEDAAKVGTFTYRLKGFREQPTDHYARTFFQLLEPMFKSLKCIGPDPMHKEWFRYVSEFMDRYGQNASKFLLAFHSVLSHDDVNLVEVADEDTMHHLKTLKESGAFDNALVIVMADHGNRFAALRRTHQGQLEERLPFFSLALPKSFRESDRGKIAWQNLKTNKERLTTPFDLHATLMDIIHWPSAEELSTMGDVSQRSMSLFRVVPSSRTCQQAGIEMHWCTCLNWETAMDSAEKKNISRMLAVAVVQTINTYTKQERSLCAPLKLDELISAKRLVPHPNLLKYKDVKDADGFVPDLAGNTKATFAYYQLKFRTVPGNALYEVTVTYDAVENVVTVDLGAISHINAYGDLPHCIVDKNYFLAAYCVCYDKIVSRSFLG